MAVVMSFVAAWLLSLGILLGLSGRRRTLEARVAAVAESVTGSTVEYGKPGSGAPAPRQPNQAEGAPLGGAVARLRLGAQRVGVRWLAGVTRRQLYAVLAGLLLLGVITRGVIAPLAAAVLLAVARRAFASRRRVQQLREFEAALPDMLTITSGALRSGYSFLQAVDMLTTETRGRMAAEFRVVLREMTLGVGVEEALTHAAERVPSKDFALIVDAVLIQRQIGGNLAEVLDIVADTIRERMRLQGEVRSLTAQGRMSMWIFLLLTPGITLILAMLDPSYVSLLWSSPPGLFMVAVAVVGQLLGAVVIRKIVSIEI